MRRRNTVKDKNKIISEYLTGASTFIELEALYGVKARTIQSWVRAFRKRTEQEVNNEPGKDIQSLKKQLEEEKLRTQLLEEMLRLSEQYTQLDLRKKFGTKQS
jgi:transposase-like protein